MKNLTKKLVMLASVLGAAVMLSGCMMECPSKHTGHRHKAATQQRMQPVEVVESDTIVVYQTYENADVNKVYAKMYTHSSRGGESKMGHIKFHDTDNGLKMVVDLKDLRPGVQYNVRLYQCGSCHYRECDAWRDRLQREFYPSCSPAKRTGCECYAGHC